MLSPLKEVFTSYTSWQLKLSDAILTPVNLVLGNRIISYSNDRWNKYDRYTDLFLEILSYLYITVFAPVILAAYQYKATSGEHMATCQGYQRYRKRELFQQQNFRVIDFDIGNDGSFSISVVPRSKSSTAHPVRWKFNCYGRILFKESLQARS